MQRITYLETCTDANKSRFKVFDDATQERFHEKYDEATFAVESSINPPMVMWAKLAENAENFKEELNKVFNDPYVKEADDGFTADSYDQYVNMELTSDQGGDRPEFARVKKILKDENVRPIGVANENPILDSRMYEVE